MLRAHVATSLIAALTLSAAAMAQQGGACVGQAWISGNEPTLAQGPDFTVYKFRTEKGSVSVYVGCCSEVSAHPRTLFLKIDGIAVNRTTSSKSFTGYLVEETHGDGPPGQLHFFGDGLSGDDRDRIFFQSVHFGKAAAERCKKMLGS